MNAPSIGAGIFPEPGRDDLDEQPFAVEDLLDLGHALERARPVEVGRHDVVVVELHGVEAQLLVRLELRAYSISLRTGGPNGSAPVLMFQGPKEKRYWWSGCLSAVMAWSISCDTVDGAARREGRSPGIFPTLIPEDAGRSMTVWHCQRVNRFRAAGVDSQAASGDDPGIAEASGLHALLAAKQAARAATVQDQVDAALASGCRHPWPWAILLPSAAIWSGGSR